MTERIIPFAEVQPGDKVRLELTRDGVEIAYTFTVGKIRDDKGGIRPTPGAGWYLAMHGYTIVLLDRSTPRSLPALMLDAQYGALASSEARGVWRPQHLAGAERALAVATPVIRQAVVAEIRAAIEDYRPLVNWLYVNEILALPALATEETS